MSEKCKKCKGKGTFYRKKCPKCHGFGWTPCKCGSYYCKECNKDFNKDYKMLFPDCND